MQNSIRLSLIFLILFFTQNLFSQENDLNYLDPQNNIIEENIDHEHSINFSSPEALNKQTFVEDFRVNEQVGNSSKNNIRSAINNSGITMVVWSDYREGTQNIYGQLFDAEGNIIGENIKVNSPEDGNKYSYPNVAVNNNGEFLVIWSDTRASYSVYGQLYNEDGSSLGENFEISDEGNTSFKYQLCLTSNGEEFIAGWLDGRNGGNYDIYAQRINKDGSRINSNFIVNADTQGVRKSYPNLSINNNGSFLQTWYSSLGGGNKIFAVILDSTNSIIGEQFEVTDSLLLNSASYSPVAESCQSGFIVSWYSYYNNNYNIFAQFIDTTSAKLGENFIVNDNLNSSQTNPSISSNSNGDFLISWTDYRNNYAEIYSQEFINDSTFGDNYKVSEEIMKGAKREASSSISDSGTVSVTWLDLSEPTEYRIYSRVFDSENPQTLSFRIDDDSFSSSETNPSMIVFDNGKSIITWSDLRERNYSVYFQMYDSESNPIGSNIRALSNTSQYNPGIVKLRDNNFTIFWREYYRGTNNQNEIVGQKFFSSGESIGEKFLISSNDLVGSSENFDAASNSSGEYALAFQKRINGYYRIYVQKYNSDGMVIGTNRLASKDTMNSYYKPKIAIDATGNFAVTYYGQGDVGSDIFLNRFDSAGVEINPTIIVNDGLDNRSQYNSDISINSNDECIVAWYDYRTTGGVYFQKYKNIGSTENFEKVDSNIAVLDYYIPFTTPTVSLNENGEFVISWTEKNNSYSDLKLRVFNNDSSPITEVLYATSNTERNQINQNLYFTNNKIYNVWQDNSEPGIGYDIWANVYDYNDLVTDISESDKQLPKEFSLSQNYPNPFNPTTTIKYTVPNVASGLPAGQASFSLRNIELKVFDILGREVAVLVNERKSAGNYEVAFDASNLPAGRQGLTSGVYFYSLKIGDFLKTKKMILLK